jgi:hypothetical protein
MPLAVCFIVKLRVPKQFGDCHASSIYRSVKHIAIWKKPLGSIKRSKYQKPQ